MVAANHSTTCDPGSIAVWTKHWANGRHHKKQCHAQPAIALLESFITTSDTVLRVKKRGDINGFSVYRGNVIISKYKKWVSSRVVEWESLKLGSALARHTGQEEGETISHLLTRPSVLLQKGLSSLLLNRIPDHPSPAIGGTQWWPRPMMNEQLDNKMFLKNNVVITSRSKMIYCVSIHPRNTHVNKHLSPPKV